MKFQQRDIDRELWENVSPGQAVDYTWEEPMLAHKLLVVLESEGVRDNSEHEYNMDVIKVDLKPCIFSLFDNFTFCIW